MAGTISPLGHRQRTLETQIPNQLTRFDGLLLRLSPAGL